MLLLLRHCPNQLFYPSFDDLVRLESLGLIGLLFDDWVRLESLRLIGFLFRDISP